MAKAGRHEVVRLPEAHCTLNPIELAWAQVKGHIKSNAHLFNLSECERLAWEGFDIVFKAFLDSANDSGITQGRSEKSSRRMARRPDKTVWSGKKLSATQFFSKLS